MYNSEDIKRKILGYLAEDSKMPYVVGNGIITNISIGFDLAKINSAKKEIAKILVDLGIDEKPLISLHSLTTLKDGTVWNSLNNITDFQALELLLACSEACGFLNNNWYTKHMNINSIGEIHSVLISGSGRSLVGDDNEWLHLIRENVVNKMYFLTDTDCIKAYATDNLELLMTPGSK